MSESAGCFDFLRGRRPFNKKGEVAAHLEAQQPQRHHGGSKVVSNVTRTASHSNCSFQPVDPCFLSSCNFGITSEHQPRPLLDAPPSYSKYDTSAALDPAVIKTVEASIDSLNRSLRKLSLAIHGKF